VYRRDWEASATHRGLFGYDNLMQESETGESSDDYGINVVTPIIQKHHNDTSVTTVLYASDLWQKAIQDPWWTTDCQTFKRTARENGLFDNWLARCKAEGKIIKPKESWRRPIYLLTEERKPIAQLVVRLLATLEMVVKDPEADVAIRQNNYEDFKAAIRLIETLILPNYANACVDGALFDDYDSVEPYPSWAYWREEA
jgi:hypothetical protein